MLESAGLRTSLRKLERELEELRNPGRKSQKNADVRKRKQERDMLLKLADAIIEAHRAGKDLSAAIEAYEHARKPENYSAKNAAHPPAAATHPEATSPAIEGTAPDVAAKQPLETAPVPAAIDGQFAPLSASPSGSSGAMVTKPIMVTARAALAPTGARGQRRRKAAGNRGGDSLRAGSAAAEAGRDASATGADREG